MKKRAVFPSIERCIVQRVVCRLGGIVDDGQIEEVLPVRKKVRPTVRSVLRKIQFCDVRWSSSGGADAYYRLLRVGGKEDHSVRSPRASASEVRVAQDQRSTPVKINRLQFVVREKAEGAAVGRPKGKGGALCARKHLCFQLIHGADP